MTLWVHTGSAMRTFDPAKDCCPWPHPCNCNGKCEQPFADRKDQSVYDVAGRLIRDTNL